MEKIINISGKDVLFKSSASTLYIYQTQFKSDMLVDMKKLQSKLDKVTNKEEQFDVIDLLLFEKIAWSLARTGNPNIPPIEQWLDDFDIFSIYEILPAISDLLLANFKSVDNQKKNLIPQETIQNH